MHPIENILQTTMSEIKNMTDVNTIVGDAVTTPTGCTIIPVSKVSFGFVSGGGEYGDAGGPANDKFPFAGGAGTGVTITPIAFLVTDSAAGGVKLLTISDRSALDKLVDNAPQIITEIKKAVGNEEQQNC